MRCHELKVWTEFWDDLYSFRKLFEVRLDDRNFEVGDTLLLREWNEKTQEYTGRQITRTITYKLSGGQFGKFGIKEDYCVLSLK